MPFVQGNVPWNKGYRGYSVKKDIIGSRNPNYKGGRSITYEGYAYIRVNGKRKLEHRHVMEQILGRALRRNEIVHHIDGDKLNNNPVNLFVCSMSQHRWLENHFADLYKKVYFNSDENRSEFVKMYGNIGTDCCNAHGKLTGLTTS